MKVVNLLKTAERALLPNPSPRWPGLLDEIDSAIGAASKQLGSAVLVASALSRSPLACFTSAESRWIDRIEHVRKATERSKKIISIRDYGARSPREVVTEEEMARGRCAKGSRRHLPKLLKEPFLLRHFVLINTSTKAEEVYRVGRLLRHLRRLNRRGLGPQRRWQSPDLGG
jgi:hypothetical protein